MSQTEIEDPIEALAQEEQAAREAAAPVEEPAAEAAPAAAEPAEGEPAAEERPAWQERFASPEEMWDELQNVNHLRGRQANELGDARERLSLYEQTYQPPQGVQAQQHQAPSGDAGDLPQLTQEQIEELYEEDPLVAMQYISAMTVAQMAAIQNQQLQPVFESVNEAAASHAMDQLKAEFGDELVHRNREALAARIAADKAYFVEPQTRHARLREALQAAEFEAIRSGRTQQAQAQTRAPNGQFAEGEGQRTAYVEGGSTPAPQSQRQAPSSPEAQILAAIDEAEVKKDAFGGLPRVTPVQ